jgi:hypothetical protein
MLVQQLIAAFHQEEHHEEAYRALDLLAQPEPKGERRSLISALASCFTRLHGTIEQVFSWLRAAPLPAVASLPCETRMAALTTLLGDPALFVKILHTDWVDASSRTESWQALTGFAQAGGGLRASLVTALAYAHPTEAKPVEDLLEICKSDPVLRSIAADAWIVIVDALLARPADLLRHLRTKIQGRQDSLDALAALADGNRPDARQRVVRSLAAAKRGQPAETTALLDDPSFKSRRNLRYLWIWVKLEGFLQALGISSFDPA